MTTVPIINPDLQPYLGPSAGRGVGGGGYLLSRAYQDRGQAGRWGFAVTLCGGALMLHPLISPY